MTLLATIPAGDPNFTLVAGVAGKTIVVRHILAAGATASLAATFRLKSNATVMTPWMRCAASSSFNWDSQRGPIQTVAGEDLRGDNPGSDGAAVLIVYDLVNA